MGDPLSERAPESTATDEKKLIGTSEAARIIGVNNGTVSAWVRQGLLPVAARTRGTHYARFSRAAIVAFAAKRSARLGQIGGLVARGEIEAAAVMLYREGADALDLCARLKIPILEARALILTFRTPIDQPVVIPQRVSAPRELARTRAAGVEQRAERLRRERAAAREGDAFAAAYVAASAAPAIGRPRERK